MSFVDEYNYEVRKAWLEQQAAQRALKQTQQEKQTNDRRSNRQSDDTCN